MIVGPGTISDGPTSSKMQDIKDGASNTIMFVEVSGDGINWMEPRDLDAKAISYMIDDGTGQGIQSDHPGGAGAAMCDGSVRFLDGSTDPETLRSMSTIAGGEGRSDIAVLDRRAARSFRPLETAIAPGTRF